jgi:8-oxo-dGTP diphosphatase
VPELPESMHVPALDRWFPDYVLVLEGAARRALQDNGDTAAASDRVRLVSAPGLGDDAIADLAKQIPGRRLVVTADRELRERCLAAGASVAGPGWLVRQL